MKAVSWPTLVPETQTSSSSLRAAHARPRLQTLSSQLTFFAVDRAEPAIFILSRYRNTLLIFPEGALSFRCAPCPLERWCSRRTRPVGRPRRPWLSDNNSATHQGIIFWGRKRSRRWLLSGAKPTLPVWLPGKSDNGLHSASRPPTDNQILTEVQFAVSFQNKGIGDEISEQRRLGHPSGVVRHARDTTEQGGRTRGSTRCTHVRARPRVGACDK